MKTLNGRDKLLGLIFFLLNIGSCGNGQAPQITAEAQAFYATHQAMLVDTLLNSYLIDSNTAGESSCNMKLLGGNENTLLLWTACRSFIDDTQVETSFSGPVKVSFDQNKITKVEAPRDGGAYRHDLEQLFPKAIIQYYFDDRQRMNELIEETTY
jgi:hypothetical protein